MIKRYHSVHIIDGSVFSVSFTDKRKAKNYSHIELRKRRKNSNYVSSIFYKFATYQLSNKYINTCFINRS